MHVRNAKPTHPQSMLGALFTELNSHFAIPAAQSPASMFTGDEKAAAQRALDCYAGDDPYWDTSDGRAAWHCAACCDLHPTVRP